MDFKVLPSQLFCRLISASGQDSWHSSVRKASHKFEAERHEATKERHRRQKEPAASQPSSAQTLICPQCSRVCASRIRFYSHQQACKNRPSTFPKSLSARSHPLSVPICVAHTKMTAYVKDSKSNFWWRWPGCMKTHRQCKTAAGYEFTDNCSYPQWNKWNGKSLFFNLKKTMQNCITRKFGKKIDGASNMTKTALLICQELNSNPAFKIRQVFSIRLACLVLSPVTYLSSNFTY